MRIHFIAIGGSIMHALAICLKQNGHQVTGSDDKIFDPARSALKAQGILPEMEGWNPAIITSDIDAVILGMHATKDNPELIEAQQKEIRIYSFPEFIAKESEKKTRVVVAGSHGKTTVTSMIMHVLKSTGMTFDYLVGSTVPGFDQGVKITNDSKLIIIEGDEYITSPLDNRPKIMWYNPHISVITGIAWDHINVYKTEESYISAFDNFINTLDREASLIYNEEDAKVVNLIKDQSAKLSLVPYSTPAYHVSQNKLVIHGQDKEYPVAFTGRHNAMNMEATRLVCKELKVPDEEFYKAIQSYSGAGKRLEQLYADEKLTVFRDFAHAPSKVSAVLNSLKEQYPDQQLHAIFEFHTFSSFDPVFIRHYKGTFDSADHVKYYVDKHALETKGNNGFSMENLKELTNNTELEIHTSVESLQKTVQNMQADGGVWVFMSSGNFGGLNFSAITDSITS